MPTHPVLGRLANKGALVATRTGITLDGVSSGSNEIVQFRELDDEGIPVVLVERLLLQVILNE
jgi:hypothetical protein